MDTNHPGDALAGLLLLQGSNDSNNYREDCSRTPTTDDSDVTPASNNIGPTPTSNDSMDVSPTSPVVMVSWEGPLLMSKSILGAVILPAPKKNPDEQYRQNNEEQYGLLLSM